jgi:hypothetical protein
MNENSFDFRTDRFNFWVQGQAALKAKSDTNEQVYKGRDREASKVTGIVLHQMGFNRGNEIEKYFPVTAHFVILPNGVLGWLHKFEESLYSSNFLNPTTIAVEFAGNLKDDRGIWWKGIKQQDALTPEQVQAGRDLLLFLRDSFGIRKVFAHRQAHQKKTNCCGPEIWSNVGEYAIRELGYEDTRDQTFGHGTPIPKTWRT